MHSVVQCIAWYHAQPRRTRSSNAQRGAMHSVVPCATAQNTQQQCTALCHVQPRKTRSSNAQRGAMCNHAEHAVAMHSVVPCWLFTGGVGGPGIPAVAAAAAPDSDSDVVAVLDSVVRIVSVPGVLVPASAFHFLDSL